MLGKLTIGVHWLPLENAINIRVSRPSVLGNPYVISASKTRDEACDEYEEWLMEKMNQGDKAVLEAMNHIGLLIMEGKNVNLQCFCKGKGHEDRRCHAEFISEVISNAITHRVLT